MPGLPTGVRLPEAASTSESWLVQVVLEEVLVVRARQQILIRPDRTRLAVVLLDVRSRRGFRRGRARRLCAAGTNAQSSAVLSSSHWHPPATPFIAPSTSRVCTVATSPT